MSSWLAFHGLQAVCANLLLFLDVHMQVLPRKCNNSATLIGYSDTGNNDFKKSFQAAGSLEEQFLLKDAYV